MDKIEVRQYKCGKCGLYLKDSDDICPECNKVVSLHQIKESKMQMDEKLSELLNAKSFICFYFDNETGNINISKSEIPNYQLAYVKQIMTMITDDQFRSTIKWT